MTCGNATYSAAAHADAVVVAAEDYYREFGCRCAFYAVLTTCIANAASLHDDFVETIRLSAFIVFKREERAVDERLTEFVAEVGCAV